MSMRKARAAGKRFDGTGPGGTRARELHARRNLYRVLRARKYADSLLTALAGVIYHVGRPLVRAPDSGTACIGVKANRVHNDAEMLGAIAILLLGPHESGNDIDRDEREMLAELATRAAASYERIAFMLLNDEVAELRAKVAALQAATY